MPFVLRVAALALLLPVVARGERLPIKVYSTADGLANNIVNRIVPDSHGFLWFCTREGLSRFDGHDFVTYGIDHGLPSAVINDLIERPDGTYWIATGNGLVRFDPRGELHPTSGSALRPAFISYSPDDDRRSRFVTSVIAREDGGLWIGTARGLYSVVDRDSRAAITLEALFDHLPEVNALAEDGSGTLWVAASSGLYKHRPGASTTLIGRHDGLPEGAVQTVLVDRSGGVWAGTTTGGIARINPNAMDRRETVARVYSVRDGLSSNWVHHLAETSDGTLWAATSGGVSRFVRTTTGELTFRSLGVAQGLPFQATHAVTEDRVHNLWVGTAIGAAKVLASGFTIFTEPDGIPTAASLLMTPTGDVMVMDGGGEWRVSRYDGRHFVSTRIPVSRLQASWGWNQMFLLDRESDWWIGTRTGVWRFSKVPNVEALSTAHAAARYTQRQGLAADIVIRLFEDSRGDVWIATVGEGHGPNGLSRWERRTGRFHHYTERNGLPSFNQFYVSSFAEDRSGDIWVGFSGDGGLARFDDERVATFTMAHGVPSGAIRNLIVDSRGRLWGASYRAGLIRCDDPAAATPTFSVYSTARGLSSNETTALVEDSDGGIYVGNGRGVDRLDPQTGRVRSYRAGDGPLLGEMQAAIRDRAGVLWFSYNSGVVRFEPTGKATPPPLVLITAIRAGGRALPLSAVGETNVGPVDVARDDGSVEIDFVAPGIGSREGVMYQYLLEGGDRGWSAPTAQRSVSYANLSPGAYRFVVRAIDADGVAGGSTASFPFLVPSPIWQRWWVLTLAGLAVAAAVQVVHRHRMRRLLELSHMRTRIAGDLHDDIGANLTRIGVLSEVVRRQVGGVPPADQHLGAIATVARESVTALNDIVWAVSPERDTLRDLARRIREHAEESFADRDTAVNFAVPEALRDTRLGGEIRRDVYLIAKEAINNAARHADCSRVSIELNSDGRRLRFVVTDDGVGFDPAADAEGDGLRNLRRRALRLGATLDISSQPRRGTSVTLEVPLPGKRGPA